MTRRRRKPTAVAAIADRYIEHVVNDGDDLWMVVKDRVTGDAFLVGSCPRETQLRVLAALNYADRHMERA